MLALDNPSELNVIEFARYKANWIYGDGNHEFPPDGTFSQDTATMRRSYGYHQAGTYSPFVIFTEKKSNSEPPAIARREITINDTDELIQSAGTPFNKRILSNAQTSDIQESAPIRPKFETAFALSAPESEFSQYLYFFYNARWDSTFNRFMPDTVAELETVILPNYMVGSYVSSGETAGDSLDLALLGGVREFVRSEYRNYIIVSPTQQSPVQKPASFDEVRFFPILKSNWSENYLPDSRYLILAVGSQSPVFENASFDPNGVSKASSDSVFFDTERLDGLRDLVRTVFPGADIDSNLYIDGTDFHIRGLFRNEVQMVGSIDPNGLEVLRICPDGEMYNVELRLEVCNEGYLVENNILVQLNDLAGSFTDLEFEAGASITNLNYKPAEKAWTFNWGETWGGVPNPYLDAASYSPQCHVVNLSVRTDWAGVQKLVDGEGLEFCVTFEQAVGEKVMCSKNFTLDPSLVLPGIGFKCGGGNCWPELIFVLIICLLAFLWDWFNWRTLKHDPDACK